VRSTALTRLSGGCETIRVVLALAILFAGVPVVIAAPTPNSGPAITIDICHPLQAPIGGAAPLMTPTLAAHRFNPSLADRGDAPDAIVASRVPLREAPDPPPPERAS
jgi:hypothetical protein